MPYCTDCGKKLPDNAIFCPNCGQRIVKTQEKSTESDKECCGTHKNTEAPGDEESKEQYTDKDSKYGDQHANDDFTYNINPNIYKTSSNENSQKNGTKSIIIVVCTVLALLIIVAALIISLKGRNSKYIGYWESSDLNFADGLLPDIYGGNSRNLISIQIEKGHDIYLVSAFEDGIISGSWEKTRTGIEAEINDDDLDFMYNKKDDTLILIIDDGLSIIFERVEGSIYDNDNEPSSIANDFYSDSTEGSMTTEISGSGSIGNDSYYISVIGAEQFLDVDERAAMRVYFEFTNNSDHNACARSALEYYARQGGKELEETYTWDDACVYGNSDRYIRPGVKIQCCYEFKYDPKGGSVDFTLFDYNLGTDGGSVTATYTPSELPGAPASPVIKKFNDPKWTSSLPSEGCLDEVYYVAVMDAELVYDYHDNLAIRVYYEFSNNSSYETSLNDALYSCAYQDGISLDWTYTTVCTETDDNCYDKVNPGETIHASSVFLLNNDSSPVEAEIESQDSYDAVGQTYKIS